MLRGEQAGNRIIVKQAYSVAVPEGAFINGIITDEDVLTETLSDMYGKNKISSRNISLVIDSSSFLYKTLLIPKTSRKNIFKIIKNEFNDIENNESMLFDYINLSEEKESGLNKILICAFDSSMFEKYLTLFNKSKLRLISVNTALCSVISLARRLECLKNSACIIAVAEAFEMVFYLFVDREYHFSTRHRFVENDSAVYREQIETVISSIIQFNKSEKTGYEISAVYFGGAKNEAGFYSHISHSFGIRAEELSFNDTVNNVSADYIYTVGNLMEN